MHSPSVLFKRALTLSQRRSGSPSPGQGGSQAWRSDDSDPYKIQAKVLPEKFKRIPGCYPRQLTFQERKAHDNELSALLAERHPLNLRNESVYLRWKGLRKNFKGSQRILRPLLLREGHLADTLEDDQAPRKQEHWAVLGGSTGPRAWCKTSCHVGPFPGVSPSLTTGKRN